MIRATVAFRKSKIKDRIRGEPRPKVEESLAEFEFLKVFRTFRSGDRARVEADVRDVDELQERLGSDYVAEISPAVRPY